jgi:hypothetical protein
MPNPIVRRAARCPYCGGGAVEDGVSFPSIVLASINSILVPSRSYRLAWRL